MSTTHTMQREATTGGTGVGAVVHVPHKTSVLCSVVYFVCKDQQLQEIRICTVRVLSSLSLLLSSLSPSLPPSLHIRVIKVAKEFVGRVSFAVSSKSEMSRETDALGLDSDAQVTVGLYDSNGKYAMTEDFR